MMMMVKKKGQGSIDATELDELKFALATTTALEDVPGMCFIIMLGRCGDGSGERRRRRRTRRDEKTGYQKKRLPGP